MVRHGPEAAPSRENAEQNEAPDEPAVILVAGEIVGVPRVVRRVVQDIRDKTKVLPDFPQPGKVASEIGEDNLREISLYSYRILYEVMLDIIYIHGVVHVRRNFKTDDLER